MTIEVEGEAEYQGIPCIAAQFTATAGFSPNTGSVTIALTSVGSSLDDDALLLPGSPFGGVRSGGTTISRADRDAAAITPSTVTSTVDDRGVVTGGELNPSGTLVLKSNVGEITIENLWIVRSEIIDFSEDGLIVARLDLADVRVFWSKRGVMYAAYNERVFSMNQPFRAFPLDRIWRDIARQLPGVVSLDVVGLAQAWRDARPTYEWRWVRPDKALSDTLDDFRLSVNLLPDGKSIEIFTHGDETAPPPHEIREDVTVSDIKFPVFNYTPDSVLVVGGVSQYELKVFLDENDRVGLAAETDDVLPEADALATYGIEGAIASGDLVLEKWVLIQEPDKQQKLIFQALATGEVGEGVSKVQQEQIDYYRRIIEELDGENEIDEPPSLVLAQIRDNSLPPSRKRLDALREQQKALEQILAQREALSMRQVDFDDELIDAAGLRKEDFRTPTVPGGVLVISADIALNFVRATIKEWEVAIPRELDKNQKAIRYLQQVIVDKQEANDKRQDRAKKYTKRLKQWLYRWYRVPVTRRSTLPMLDMIGFDGKKIAPYAEGESFTEVYNARSRTGKSWVNVTLGPLPAKIERKTGIVKFDEITGNLLRAGLTPNPDDMRFGQPLLSEPHTIDENLFVPSSHVIVSYLTEKKGGHYAGVGEFAESLASDHFHATFVREGGNVVEVPTATLNSQPELIVDPTLVEYVATSAVGAPTNAGELKARAFERAAAILNEPRFKKGRIVKALGVHPVWAGPVVGQVRWIVSENECTTDVVYGALNVSTDGSPTFSMQEALGSFGRGDRRGSRSGVKGASR